MKMRTLYKLLEEALRYHAWEHQYNYLEGLRGIFWLLGQSRRESSRQEAK